MPKFSFTAIIKPNYCQLKRQLPVNKGKENNWQRQRSNLSDGLPSCLWGDDLFHT